MSSIADIIEALGGTGTVASALGLNASTVSSWRARGSIPADRWREIVDFAKDREIDVTLEALATLHAKPIPAEARP